MNHIAAALAAALVLGVPSVGAAQESSVPRSSRAQAKGPCASGRSMLDEDHRRVVVTFSNRCEARVGCSVSWSLRCDKGGVEQKTAQVRVDGHGEGEVEASAASCGDGDWRIGAPTWRCEDPDERPISERPAKKR